jgi:molybdopterin-guanine dinucleotide biosynthesis protein A
MPPTAQPGHEGALPEPFGIIILAGGKGSRLGGQDKPCLTVGGRTLLGSVVAAGTAAGARQVVVVGPERPGLDGVSFVGEQPPGAGPVPALRRGLAEASWPWVGLLAADLPFLRQEHLSALVTSAAGHHGAVLVDGAGRPQWLVGCWRTEVLRGAATGYRGSSLRGLLGPLSPVLVSLAPAPGEPPPWLDCDTPEDLRRARELASADG